MRNREILSRINTQVLEVLWQSSGSNFIFLGHIGSICGWGAKIPHTLQPKDQNIKLKQYCDRFNKD